jgi:hypothetical protein
VTARCPAATRSENGEDGKRMPARNVEEEPVRVELLSMCPYCGWKRYVTSLYGWLNRLVYHPVYGPMTQYDVAKKDVACVTAEAARRESCNLRSSISS